MKFNRAVMATCFLGMLAPSATFAQPTSDIQGSSDHSLVTRYPGSFIGEYQTVEFDEFTLPLSRPDAKPPKTQHLEGKITRIVYAAPAHRSVLEIYRNYEAALKKGGFQALFSCVNVTECSSQGPVMFAAKGAEDWRWYAGQRYLAAKLARAEGDVYVSLFIGQWSDLNEGPAVHLYVVEVKPMEGGLVTVDATALANDITQSGHTAIYGIYFDTGKAEVKAESEDAIKEIAKLLEQNSSLKLLVVGHTDNVGTLASNMDLSKRRAAAVVAVLTAKHGVAAARLLPQGAGPLAPVASNSNEDGRAKNRRVELVEQ